MDCYISLKFNIVITSTQPWTQKKNSAYWLQKSLDARSEFWLSRYINLHQEVDPSLRLRHEKELSRQAITPLSRHQSRLAIALSDPSQRFPDASGFGYQTQDLSSLKRSAWHRACNKNQGGRIWHKIKRNGCLCLETSPRRIKSDQNWRVRNTPRVRRDEGRRIKRARRDTLRSAGPSKPVDDLVSRPQGRNDQNLFFSPQSSDCSRAS